MTVHRSIDLTATAVLELALRVGEVLLSSGTSAQDTVAYVHAVTRAYGLATVEVDVTFTSITASAHRGPSQLPVSSMRVVRYRSLDHTRLAGVDRLVLAIERGELDPARADAELDRITNAPHPYPRWVATLGWAGMAASVALLLGGGPLVLIVAFFSTVAIDRSNRMLNRYGLPFFFQQVVGGFIATMPATALFAARGIVGIDVAPSQVVAAGVVVLLSGLSLVGSVQDAINGALVTGSARLAEVLLLTAGIVVGLALALQFSAALGVELPALDGTSPSLARLPLQLVAAALTSAFFALASYAERRALLAAAAAGAVGWAVYGPLTQTGLGPVLASAFAATIVGLAGALFSRRFRIPPLVVAISGIAPLLPALRLYRGLYELINDDALVSGLGGLGGAIAVAGALAAGVVLGEWLAAPVRTGYGLVRRRRPARPRRGDTLG